MVKKLQIISSLLTFALLLSTAGVHEWSWATDLFSEYFPTDLPNQH